MTTTIKISGYSNNEGVREFEILDRKQLESIIDELDQAEIYRKTFDEAKKREGHSGTAYTYISSIDGKIGTVWLQQNNFNHPWDDFDQIILCRLKTDYQNMDFNNPEYLLADNEEYEEFGKFEGTAEDFVAEKFGQEELDERYDNLIDCLATEFGFDWDNIKEQLDHLYACIK
jgi:hypothetical protein